MHRNGSGHCSRFAPEHIVPFGAEGAPAGRRAIRRIDGDGFVSTLFDPARGFDTTLGPLPASVGIPEDVAVLVDGRLAISVLNGILVTDGVRF